MAGPFDFTGQNIENTYQRVLQTPDGTTFYDGTGSLVTLPSANTASLLITASATGNTITFTKGDGNTFPVTVTGGTGTPGGPEQSLQFNSASVFGGSTKLKYDYVNSNVILTGSLFVTQSYISTVDYVDFTTGTDQAMIAGRLGWNDSDGTLDIGLKGGNLNLLIGETEVAYVFNAEATTLNKGEVVYITGSQGNRISVKRAFATADATSAGTLGFAAETIASGQTGFITVRGVLRKLDTAAFPEGALVYLSSSAGQYTVVKPQAPIHEVRLGYIERSHATVGSIYVKVDNGYEIEELHDIRIISASNGDLLVRSGSLWANSKQLTGSYGLTGSAYVTQGMLFATSSWAESSSVSISSSYALSASYASTASFAPNYVLNSTTSSMLAPYVLNSQTSSFITNSQTSSFVVNSQTSSFVTNNQTSSFITTASVSLNTITFTKGNDSQFSITVNTGSGGGGGITELTGDVTAGPGSGTQVATLKGTYKSGSFGMTADGQGGVITTGEKGYIVIPYSCSIVDWTLLADRSGSIGIDIRKSTYATFPPTSANTICGAANYPYITNNSKNTDSTLTGWSKTLNAGDILSFNVTSSVSITRINLIVDVIKV